MSHVTTVSVCAPEVRRGLAKILKCEPVLEQIDRALTKRGVPRSLQDLRHGIYSSKLARYVRRFIAERSRVMQLKIARRTEFATWLGLAVAIVVGLATL